MGMGMLLENSMQRRKQTIECQSHLKQLGMAIRLMDDRFPSAKNWCDWLTGPESGRLAGQILVCPARPGLRSGFAYNVRLAGLTLEEADQHRDVFRKRRRLERRRGAGTGRRS